MRGVPGRTLDAGPVTVALHLTSLGHNELILGALEGSHRYSDWLQGIQGLRAPLSEACDALVGFVAPCMEGWEASMDSTSIEDPWGLDI